jgi:hypothetical protein
MDDLVRAADARVGRHERVVAAGVRVAGAAPVGGEGEEEAAKVETAAMKESSLTWEQQRSSVGRKGI